VSVPELLVPILLSEHSFHAASAGGGKAVMFTVRWFTTLLAGHHAAAWLFRRCAGMISTRAHAMANHRLPLGITALADAGPNWRKRSSGTMGADYGPSELLVHLPASGTYVRFVVRRRADHNQHPGALLQSGTRDRLEATLCAAAARRRTGNCRRCAGLATHTKAGMDMQVSTMKAANPLAAQSGGLAQPVLIPSAPEP
jgi:hypothetical protein